MRVVVIPVKGPMYEAEISNDLQGFKDYIDGYIESVSTPLFTAIIDEEGKLKGLPWNARATWMLRERLGDDYIAGPCVLCGPVDKEGELTDVPEHIKVER